MTTFGDNRERSRPPRESLEDNEIQTMADLEARIGPGRPLETSVADRMGSALGPHVRSARLHTDSQASEVARVHDAKALAVGHHVVLEAGGYRPGTLEGDALLAHELAHVSQQIGAANAPGARVEQIGGESREAEAQADLATPERWPTSIAGRRFRRIGDSPPACNSNAATDGSRGPSLRLSSSDPTPSPGVPSPTFRDPRWTPCWRRARRWAPTYRLSGKPGYGPKAGSSSTRQPTSWYPPPPGLGSVRAHQNQPPNR